MQAFEADGLQKRVIHRDLKPSNVLVSVDDVRSSQGIVLSTITCKDASLEARPE
jgi:serine/threonine protein kinase